MIIFTQIEMFLFIMAILVILNCILHVIAVFSLKTGQLVTSNWKLALFGASFSYILTMLICGFI
jgi:hypothetical protein